MIHQHAAQTWGYILDISGGKLEITKFTVYIIKWKFNIYCTALIKNEKNNNSLETRGNTSSLILPTNNLLPI